MTISAPGRSAMLRVATLNIHKGLSQFNRRLVIHELREGLRAVDADIVFLQEVQGTNRRHAARFADCPPQSQYEFLAEGGWQHAYGRNAEYGHGHHGNALLSRHPIVSCANHDVSNHRFESRGLLYCSLEVPGWNRGLHCICAHLSLHEGGRRKQLRAIVEMVETRVPAGEPVIIAGDFNDWRHRAGRYLGDELGVREVHFAVTGRPARTFPSLFPLLRLDRIYVRGFSVLRSHAHRGLPWSLLSDHLVLSTELGCGPA
jgi:endonuclease/exonuclease/phosphatase family metal-dependent hydrolase